MGQVEMCNCRRCDKRIIKPAKGQPKLCESCKKRGKPPKADAMWKRLPGSFESGKRR